LFFASRRRSGFSRSVSPHTPSSVRIAALAGVLLGLMSAGSALGGLAYGSRAWHFPLARQFAAARFLLGR
jgi:hypothetical protein